MSDFASQVALITGASRGIGRKIAESFAVAGAEVVFASRNLPAIESAVEELRNGSYQARALVLDVSNPEQVKEAIAKVLEQVGKIDILVNNAGITRDSLLLRMKWEDWREVLSVNLDGIYSVTREILPSMLRQRYGRIINITSVVAQMGNAGQVNYVSSKAGIIGFTKALAREVGARNVTVNAVAPGFVETEMTQGLDEKNRRQLQEMIPLKRIGTVEDVAFGVRFLASKEAGYITGHVLNINGGMYM
ncbi:MAG: 3-oxoacyl-[acyl-carrier-protein] reductase [Acidobacteria bacterium]|nr:3-oxoacyl-[acyl-carrier-protein] reductase [Acidobacteriota bacterium]